MNWDALGTIAEIVGALAVVVSIAYLAVQIRTNTKAIKASASFEATHSWAEFNRTMLGVPDEMVVLCIKAYDPATKISDLSDIEYWRLVAMHRTIFQSLEAQYYQYRYGFLETDVWDNRVKVARGILDLPVFHEWWKQEVQTSTYSNDFVRAIEESEPADTYLINRKPNQEGC